jgi:hypothetical protein
MPRLCAHHQPLLYSAIPRSIAETEAGRVALLESITAQERQASRYPAGSW